MPSVEHRSTFCRICEPLCGMVATVEDGRLVALRPDKDHPLSAGFACQKGIAFTEVVNDPDRVTTPLRRVADGRFEPVSWDEAMTDIAKRLADIHRRHGPGGIGWYFGNPGAFSYSHTLWLPMFVAAMGMRMHLFTAGSQTSTTGSSPASCCTARRWRCRCPMCCAPTSSSSSARTRSFRTAACLQCRGSRTACTTSSTRRPGAGHRSAQNRDRRPIRVAGHRARRRRLPSALATARAVRRRPRGPCPHRTAGRRCRVAAAARRAVDPEATEERTGIAPDTVRALARDLASTPRAAVYGRVGTSTGENGTLTTYLLDAVNLLAGNLDQQGGSMFGRLGIPGERWLNQARCRIAANGVLTAAIPRSATFRQCSESEPAGVMAKEMTTPGRGQIKALLVSAGNPVLSVPNGDELEDAMRGP